MCVFLCACGGSSSSGGLLPPFIELAPTGGGWASLPVEDGLGAVSNNGAGYTGEIDLYEVVTPAPGRLQVSLAWDHGADFDVVLAADPQGVMRLAEGVRNDGEPEYVGLDVAGGQIVYVLVAGWEGDPGDYTLETTLLPFDAPVFDLESLPNPGATHPRNAPLVFTFNVELDPEQDPLEGLVFLGPGVAASGTWCIEGRDLTFYPRLPDLSSPEGGLVAGHYTVQFPRAARGLRAATGEYLSELRGATYTIDGHLDPDAGEPPRVLDVNPDPAVPWTGGPLVITIDRALDPATLRVDFVQVTGGGEIPVPARVELRQQYTCLGVLTAAIEIVPTAPLPPAATLRVRIPGDVLALGGSLGLTGRLPLPAGVGFQVDFATP